MRLNCAANKIIIKLFQLEEHKLDYFIVKRIKTKNIINPFFTST